MSYISHLSYSTRSSKSLGLPTPFPIGLGLLHQLSFHSSLFPSSNTPSQCWETPARNIPYLPDLTEFSTLAPSILWAEIILPVPSGKFSSLPAFQLKAMGTVSLLQLWQLKMSPDIAWKSLWWWSGHCPWLRTTGLTDLSKTLVLYSLLKHWGSFDTHTTILRKLTFDKWPCVASADIPDSSSFWWWFQLFPLTTKSQVTLLQLCHPRRSHFAEPVASKLLDPQTQVQPKSWPIFFWGAICSLEKNSPAPGLLQIHDSKFQLFWALWSISPAPSSPSSETTTSDLVSKTPSTACCPNYPLLGLGQKRGQPSAEVGCLCLSKEETERSGVASYLKEVCGSDKENISQARSFE